MTSGFSRKASFVNTSCYVITAPSIEISEIRLENPSVTLENPSVTRPHFFRFLAHFYTCGASDDIVKIRKFIFLESIGIKFEANYYCLIAQKSMSPGGGAQACDMSNLKLSPPSSLAQHVYSYRYHTSLFYKTAFLSQHRSEYQLFQYILRTSSRTGFIQFQLF